MRDPKAHSKFKQKVVKELRSKGCWWVSIHGHKMQKSGVPDLLVIGKSWKGFLEFKTGSAKASPIQCRQMEKLIARGFMCYVLRWCPDTGVSGSISIENPRGDVLCFVELDTLWDWLKNSYDVTLYDN